MSKVLALLALLLYYCTISQLEGGYYVRGASCTSFTKFTTAFFTNALLVNRHSHYVQGSSFTSFTSFTTSFFTTTFLINQLR
jgi:hypothetical protein